MSDEFQERLRSHARAFDGLLSLIPAKLYYGEDNSDQWQRKKQTKEQKRAARIAKLDPENFKSAKDVLDQQAAAAREKRKREEEEGADNSSEALQSSQMLGSGLETQDQRGKKRKLNANQSVVEQQDTPAVTEDDKRRRMVEKKASKRERKLEKKHRKEAKKERQRMRKAESSANERFDADAPNGHLEEPQMELTTVKDVELLATKTFTRPLSTTSQSSSSSPDLAPFDSSNAHSASSSISSVQPGMENELVIAEDKSAPTTTNTNKPSAEEIKARFAARIEALRAARKADGFDGRPARSRQELLEARRKKEEQRKAHKKELRRKAKEEEIRKQDEELAKRFSPGGSGSLLASPRSPMTEQSFSFNRIAFNDGSQMNQSQSSMLNPTTSNRKGPSDLRTAVNAAENKNARLSGLDPSRKAEIEEKDLWLNARRKANGENVKDDASLLKRALKRQESRKGKSEKSWKDRTDNVEKGIKARQQKREDNLRKRRDDSRGGKKGKSRTKVKRPGFEGSFRAKHGSNGKK